MPNTLAHFGISGTITRTFIKKSELIWIYIGAIVPDIPWIIQRVISIIIPGINIYDIRLYCIVLASLFFSLIMSFALANLSANTKKTFLILASGTLIHLLLDSVEIKWANGVHLFAPFSWKLFNAGFFWPEDMPIYLITFFGLLYLLFNFKESVSSPLKVNFRNRKKIFVFIAFSITYFLLPILFVNNVEAADNHFVKTLRNKELRPGSYFEVDRGQYINLPDGDRIITPFKENLTITNLHLTTPANMSIRARFISPDKIQIIDYHVHSNRDIYSYAGLSLLLILFVFLGVRNIKNRSNQL